MERLAAAAGRVQPVLVRVTPGIDADTHDKIRTGHHGSKFGFAAAGRAGRARPRGLAAARAAGRPARAPGIADQPAGDVRERGRLAGRVHRGARAGRAAGARPGRRAGHRPRAGRHRARDPAVAGGDLRAPDRRADRPRAADAGAGGGAGPLDRRAGRHDAVPGRIDQARGRRHRLRGGGRRHVGQPAAGAVRRALHGGRLRPAGRARAQRSTRSPASTASPATS